MSKLAVVPPAAAEPNGPDAPAKKKLPAPILFGGAAVLGLALGAFLLAPQLFGGGGSVSADSHGASSAGAHGGKGGGAHGGGGGGGKHGAASIVEIENIVVNPAGAEGMHFIMASVSLEVPDKAAQAWIGSNEHVVRDAILGLFGRQTLEQLCRPGAREQMKTSIAAEMSRLVPGAPHVTVYLPEFVVQ
jgi:flagellar basal body-associated protein FliL